MKPNFILFLFCLFGANSLVAQKAITSAGGNFSGSGGSISFSVGQVDYLTYKNSAYTFAQGIQQPYEIFVITGIQEASLISLQIKAYPNPVTEYLLLDVGNYSTKNLSFQLTDINGKTMEKQTISQKETVVDAKMLPTGPYILMVWENSNMIRSFKIIKQ